MDHKIYQTQKRLSIFIAFIGFAVSISNTFLLLFFREVQVIEIIKNPSVTVVFICAVIFYGIRNLQTKLPQYLQIGIFLLWGVYSIFDMYEGFNGIGFIVLVTLLMYKYGLFKSHAKIKLFIIGIITVFSIEGSIAIKHDMRFGTGFSYILYLVFFFTILYIIYSAEIKRILKVEKRYEATIHNLEAESYELKDQIEKTEFDLSSMKEKYAVLQKKINTSASNRIDPSQAKLSKLEQDVLRTLCRNPKYTNKQIAYYLETTENSVKQYNKRLFKKLDVDSRGEMIQRCSWYYDK